MIDIGDEKEIEVPIEDDGPVEVVLEGEKPSQDTVDDREKALLEVKSQLEEVNRRHEQEKIARHRAEQYALEQAKAAQYAQADLHSSNYKVVLSGIENMQQTIEQAKRTYSDAMASGDYSAAAEANNVLAWANANLKGLYEGKSDIEKYLQATEGRVADTPPQQPQYEPPPQPLSQEQQFEALLSKLSPRSASWLREHPNAAADMNRLSAAHQAATVLKGIKAESPEYFSYIENELGISNNRSNIKRQAMASTPVTSSSPTIGRSGYNGGSTMTLSAAEVEQALLMDPDLPREKAIETYARNKAALIREGKLSA